ncbi:MAG: 23S rRNA (uracil1939-C5)-methyltransferase [Myxococcota bacterium]|jgi:23S rRNA (uracil1939-C5)-methyltransferase
MRRNGGGKSEFAIGHPSRRPALGGRNLIIDIERMANGPAAVGRAANGKVVMVLGGAPGDTVEVEITREHRRYDEARVVRVIEPGPGRQKPPCEHARLQECGGCGWQHLTVEAQRAEKRAFVAREMHRVDPEAEVRAIRTDVPPFGYRRRTRLGYRDGIVGFRRPAQRRIFSLTQCPVLAPKINDSLPAVRDAVSGRGSGNIDVLFDGESVIIGGTARNFRQPAAEGEAALIDMVLEAVDADAATVAELFCGSGTFTIPLDQRGHQVRAWEMDGGAVAALADAAPNVDAYRADLLRSEITPGLGSPDVVLLDPPRSGAGPCMEAIGAAAPKTVVYVSCAPMTLCRDLRVLLPFGYRIDWVAPLDAFPQTPHVEVVVRLVRVQ